MLPDRPLMEPDIRPTGLPAVREREMMPVRGQVPEPVQRGGRAVGYDSQLWCPVPCRNLRGEHTTRGLPRRRHCD